MKIQHCLDIVLNELVKLGARRFLRVMEARG